MSVSDGRIIWLDLVTSSVADALAHYGRVVGFTREDFQGEGFTYTMLKGAEQLVGGVMDAPERGRAAGDGPHWIGYHTTADVDATVALAESLGGKLVTPAVTAPGTGRWAVLEDPTGAVFAAFHTANPTEPKPQPGRGEVAWSELMTSDPDAALRFYAALFGWVELSRMDMGDMGAYRIVGTPGTSGLAGFMGLPPGTPRSAWCQYFHVEDVPTAVAAAQEAGATLLSGPMEIPGGGVVAMLTDPQGALYALHHGSV